MPSSKYILIFNCGSSSIKFALIEPLTKEKICNGLVQRIGSAKADMKIVCCNGQKEEIALPNIGYREALQKIFASIPALDDYASNVVAIGHRVVHGGEEFIQSVVINDTVLETIKKCAPLAPLHNPANIIGIEEAKKAFPHLPQVAVFDTSFHQTMPEEAFIYAIPYSYYEKHKIRRYGFHGTSHRFVSREAAIILKKDLSKCAFITAHLGNGCSAAAILNGKSIDTSMGFTPLEGLMMGTRSGDVDPGLHAFICNNLGLSIDQVNDMLNKQSGLLGITETNSDMRAIEHAASQGNKRAQLALDIFCYKLAKYIGALAVPLGRIDALIFTGGIGENSQLVRAKTLNMLSILNFKLDEKRNDIHGNQSNGVITTKDSTVAMVVRTDEELLIAQDTLALV